MHTMYLVREHEGLEEWHCPGCGRHLLVNWSPSFKRTVVQEGDSSVGHSGFKNELQSESLEGTSFKAEKIKPIDESRLTPWSTWMDKTDFADLWNDNGQ